VQTHFRLPDTLRAPAQKGQRRVGPGFNPGLRSCDLRLWEEVALLEIARYIDFMTSRIKMLFAFVMIVASAAAAQSQLDLDLIVEPGCYGWNVAYGDCDEPVEIIVGIGNQRDWPVEEGSTVLGDSLSLGIFNHQGELVAWWQPDEEATDGQPRTWQPSEWDGVVLNWYMKVGPLMADGGVAAGPGTSMVPFAGYLIRATWKDIDGTVLLTRGEYLEHIPANEDYWPSNPWFFPSSPTVGSSFAMIAAGGCGSTPSWAEDRWVELVDGTVRVFVIRNQGPFASPSSYRFATRLPALEAGRYPVEVWRVWYDMGEPAYSLIESTTLVVSEELPVPTQPSALD